MKEPPMPIGKDMVNRASAVPAARADGTLSDGERVLLVSMPFGALERPALSLGLLQAHCRRLDIPCETRYLTFAFAEQVGAGITSGSTQRTSPTRRSRETGCLLK